MPQIPATPHPLLTILQVIAFLESPHDEKKRGQLLSDMAGVILGQAFLRDTINPGALSKEQRRVIVNAPSPESFYQSVADEMDAYTRDVASIFLSVLTLAEHATVLASVNNAVALQMRRRALDGKRPCSREHLMRKWSQLKPVSHFLAAMELGCMSDLIQLPAIAGVWKQRKDRDIEFDRDAFDAIPFEEPKLGIRILFALVDWAAAAEELRRRAARTFAHGQSTALLTSDEAWFFGPEVPLPQPEFCFRKPLREELDFLLT